VALGAAIQAHALVHPHKGSGEVLLLDVTPQNLGIMVVGGYFQTIIPRNTTVPTSQTHIFTTSQDGQTSVRIAVMQGASEKAVDNELLGEFVLGGIRPARRGEVEIEVTFDISADGIVGVSAKDLVTGQRQSITVTATSGLTEEELRHILDEHLDDLLERKQGTSEFERRREAAERLIQEVGGLLPAVSAALVRSRVGSDTVDKAQAAVRRAREAMAARDADELVAAEEQLDRMLQVFRGLVGDAGEGAS
jgi:molecular chaperone DnaK